MAADRPRRQEQDGVWTAAQTALVLMTRPLSDSITLRDTSVWPGYDSIEIIPRVYGSATVGALRYSENGTTLVLADHALQGVDSVTVDGEALDGWRWRNGADVTGHAVAFLDLPEALDTGVEITAEVRGLSGNPADIIVDIYPRSDLQDFRIWCANQGLILGGALDNKMTIRTAISFILDQVGAVWSAGLPGFAVPFPPAANGPLHVAFGPLDISDWSAECSLENLVTRVTVPFDWGYAAGQARQSLILEALGASARHGVREAELALPWVKTARLALKTARTWLRWRARPLWTLQFSAGVQYRNLHPGGWISLSHPRLPIDNEAVIMDVDPRYGQGSVSITAQSPAGSPPPVTLVGQSGAFDPIRTEYTINAGGDVATVTITDESGNPLPGAQVWVDGKGSITADAEAKVRFQATPGRHVLRIEADGRTAITTEISL